MFNKSKLIVGILFLISPLFALDTITDTLRNADGTFATGNITINWPAYVNGSGQFIPAGSKIVVLGSSGSFTTPLDPNDTMTPVGTLYTVTYQLGGSPSPPPQEYWSCPTAGSPITIAQCRTTSVPSPSGIINISQLFPSIATIYPAAEIAGSANNALVANTTNGSLTLTSGLCIILPLTHSLTAGANTLNLNSLGVIAIKSHRAVANNISTGYTIGGGSAPIINLCTNGTVWLDMSQ